MRKTKSIILAALTVGITLYALWVQNRPVVIKTAAHEDVLIEAEQGGYRLIDTSRLWELYQKKSDDVLIVDTRQEWEYRMIDVDVIVEKTGIELLALEAILESRIDTGQKRNVATSSSGPFSGN